VIVNGQYSASYIDINTSDSGCTELKHDILGYKTNNGVSYWVYKIQNKKNFQVTFNAIKGSGNLSDYTRLRYVVIDASFNKCSEGSRILEANKVYLLIRGADVRGYYHDYWENTIIYHDMARTTDTVSSYAVGYVTVFKPLSSYTLENRTYSNYIDTLLYLE
jgi:hypothetical protein